MASEGLKQYLEWLDYDLKKLLKKEQTLIIKREVEFLLEIRERFIRDHPNWEGESNEALQRRNAERIYCLNAKKGNIDYNELTGFSQH